MFGDGYGLEVNELSMRYRAGDDELDTEIISLLRHVDEATANSSSR